MNLDRILQVLALVYTVVFSALHYSILCSRENINFGSALGREPEAAVSFILGLILLAPITALFGYHLRVGLSGPGSYIESKVDLPPRLLAHVDQRHNGRTGESASRHS